VGCLYLIPTPIGNQRDITQRALDLLAGLPVIACEDTRTTKRLLAAHGVEAQRLISYTEHNKRRRIAELVAQLNESDVGLVSEAGMPGISDPGQDLVAAAIEAGHEVIALPGPSAVLSALAASGLSTRRFLFLGFLPRSAGQRKSALARVAELDATLVIFESPRRVLATLADIQSVLGDRRIAAAREISKVHEEVIRGRVSDVLKALVNPLGEFTLVVEGATERVEADETDATALAVSLSGDGLSTRDIAQRLEDSLGMSRRRAYNIASRAKESG
jgi:16S rRNA (cytidine1402-2'-O)-methyltransferase